MVRCRGGEDIPQQKCLWKWTQISLQVEPHCLRTQSAMLNWGWAPPLPIPLYSLARHNAFGISTGTLGTCCLPDTDCGLVIVHPREKIGACLVRVNTVPFLSTHLSLKETSCSKEPVATKHPFSFKGRDMEFHKCDSSLHPGWFYYRCKTVYSIQSISYTFSYF